MNTWELIASKDYQAACNLADEEFKQTKDVHSLINKVYALLLMEKFEEVIATENIIIDQNKGNSDSDFIFYGIALWFLNKSNEAITKWKEGEKCLYTDAAGGIQLQIILYFASLKTKDKKGIEFYFKKIQKLVSKSKNNTFWPFPLGAYLLGNIQFEQLEGLTSINPILKQRQLCQAYFLKSIKELENSNIDGYYETIKKAVIEFQETGILEKMYFIMKAELFLNGTI